MVIGHWTIAIGTDNISSTCVLLHDCGSESSVDKQFNYYFQVVMRSVTLSNIHFNHLGLICKGNN